MTKKSNEFARTIIKKEDIRTSVLAIHEGNKKETLESVCKTFDMLAEIFCPDVTTVYLEETLSEKDKNPIYSIGKHPFEIRMKPYRGKIYVHAWKEGSTKKSNEPYLDMLCEVTSTKEKGITILLRGHEANYMKFTESMLKKHETTGSYCKLDDNGKIVLKDGKIEWSKEKTNTFRTSKEFSCAFKGLNEQQAKAILKKVLNMDIKEKANSFPYDNSFIVGGKEEEHEAKKVFGLDLANDDERRDED